MLRVAECLTRDHDLRLVALAALVCLVSTGAGLRLLNPRRVGQALGTIRLGGAILTLGSGFWVTHFVSILAFRPDVPFTLDVPLCILSLMVSVTTAGVTFTAWFGIRGSDARAAASGLVLAVGIGAMHLIATQSLVGPGVFHQRLDLMLASFVLTAICTTTATAMLVRRNVAGASVCLMLGVWFGHFVSMGSLTFEHAGGLDLGPQLIPHLAPALAAAGASCLVMAVTVAGVAIERRVINRVAGEARRFRVLADATLDGLIFERHGQIVDMNSAMRELAGAGASALIGRPLTDLIPAIELRLSGRGHPVEHEMSLQDGRTVAVEASWQNGPDTGGHVIAVRDLTRTKSDERQIERLASIDPLTGLLSRDRFEQELHQILTLSAESATVVDVLYVDLDGYELINEALGHRAASEILIQTGRRLSAIVAPTGAVARLGRDAFAIVQPLAKPDSVPAGPHDPGVLAERVLAEMALPFVVDEQPIAVTASIGIAVYPNDSSDARTLVECAILAVCQAKRDGHGHWRRFQPNMDLLVLAKRSLGHDLRIALRDHQFSLNYQPFVDTTTLKIIGYEALLRWDHPERGRISPADFIPAAENSGLIVPIGSWVLQTACAEAALWDNGAVISVNLSPAQFIQPGIVARVAEVLHQTGLPPNRLELEITEGTLMDDTQNALRTLLALKALGVKLAMDDFGTGYSSLSYLRNFPFDKIKIDRSFISDTDASTDAETIVRAIIAMGHSLRLRITAEGVETQQQLEMLQGLGCDFIQGFLTGKPRTAAQINLHAVKTPGQAVAVLGPAVSGPRLVATASAQPA